MDPSDWLTEDYRLRSRRYIEELQSDLDKASDANSYSWVKKGNITRELAGNKPGKVLDVGCGWGRELCRFENAVGMDICLPFLKAARVYGGSKNDVLLDDALFLPFGENTFDLVIISEAIEHVETPERVMSEIRRVLKDRGRLILQPPNKLFTGGILISKKYRHIKEFTSKELTRFLTEQGFRVLKRTGSTLPYIPSQTRFDVWNGNRCFFALWKALNRIVPLKWDMIVLAELRKGAQIVQLAARSVA